MNSTSTLRRRWFFTRWSLIRILLFAVLVVFIFKIAFNSADVTSPSEDVVRAHPSYLALEQQLKEVELQSLQLQQTLQAAENIHVGDEEGKGVEKKKNHEEDRISERVESYKAEIGLLKLNLEQQKKTILSSTRERSTNFRLLSRRISNQLREMQRMVHGNQQKIIKKMKPDAQKDVQIILNRIDELHSITERDFEELISMDGVKGRNDETAIRLSKQVQERFQQLQNPSNCSSAKILLVKLRKACGYGCLMHHLVYGMIMAYAHQRTLVLASTIGDHVRFEDIYLDLTPCRVSTSEEVHLWRYWMDDGKRVVGLPLAEFLDPPSKHMPMAVPRDLYDDVRSFHVVPFIWWIGQVCKYVFRLQKRTESLLESKKKNLGFKKPIVGVHVRRTDKLNVEASKHLIEEYMQGVKRYYDRLELNGPVGSRRVFLATDEPMVVEQAKLRYPDYTFVHDSEASASANDHNSRFKKKAVHGIASDIQLLSETDFIVCTFSSQVCRLAYEIMNSQHTDASQLYYSLDDIYYFGGQQEHRLRALWAHKGEKERTWGGFTKQMDLNVGDTIKIAGNNWNGESLGTNILTDEQGLFPSYKLEEIDIVEDFPTYDLNEIF